ncbi:MAG: fibronectin type III domain-containing protein [Nitrospirae bacterium]|nr:fibronectin type III domain-containing protein [Nitrospirota bacterium]
MSRAAALKAVLIFSLIMVPVMMNPVEAASVTDSCTYFFEDFSGLSANSWTWSNGSWSLQGEMLNVDQITSGKMAHAEAAFYPYDFFTLDVDVYRDLLPQGGAYGIYPFTNGDAYLGVDQRTLDGVGAIIFGSGNAYLIGWDVVNKAWYQSEKLAAGANVNSIGVAYSENAITLRINRQDTSLKFQGNFAMAPLLINTLWLTAQESGTDVRFDNVCAGPLNAAGPSAPQAPQNLHHTLSENSLTISWNAVTGATGYRLSAGLQTGNYIYEFDMGNITQIGPIDVSWLPAGTYYIAVQAYNSSGESGYSNEISFTKSAASLVSSPSNLRYSYQGDAITILWDAAAGASGYRGYFGAGPGNYAGSIELGTNTQLGPMSVSWIPAGMYYFAVGAYGPGAESGNSNEIRFKVAGGRILAGELELDPTGSSGEVSGRYITFSDNRTFRFNAAPGGNGKATASILLDSSQKQLSVSLSEPGKGSITWNGLTMDGNGSLSASEKSAITDLASGELSKAIALIPLEIGCRATGMDPSAAAALLMPWQMVLKYNSTDRLTAVQNTAVNSSCRYFTDLATNSLNGLEVPSLVILSNETPIPHVYGYFPLDGEGALEGSATSAATPEPTNGREFGTCGSRCRGTCGPDCAPANCVDAEEWRCLTDGENNTGEKTKWIIKTCKTHEGCRWHDDCFESCLKTYGCGSWGASNCMHNLANGCDVQAAWSFGAGNCWSWKSGGGPFDSDIRYEFITEETETDFDFCPTALTYSGSGTAGISVEVIAENKVYGTCSDQGGPATFWTTVTPGKAIDILVNNKLGWEFVGDGMKCSASTYGTQYIIEPGIAKEEGTVELGGAYVGSCIYNKEYLSCNITETLGPHHSEGWSLFGPNDYYWTSWWSYNFTIPRQ